jgi:hypothetical protein
VLAAETEGKSRGVHGTFAPGSVNELVTIAGVHIDLLAATRAGALKRHSDLRLPDQASIKYRWRFVRRTEIVPGLADL